MSMSTAQIWRIPLGGAVRLAAPLNPMAVSLACRELHKRVTIIHMPNLPVSLHYFDGVKGHIGMLESLGTRLHVHMIRYILYMYMYIHVYLYMYMYMHTGTCTIINLNKHKQDGLRRLPTSRWSPVPSHQDH